MDDFLPIATDKNLIDILYSILKKAQSQTVRETSNITQLHNKVCTKRDPYIPTSTHRQCGGAAVSKRVQKKKTPYLDRISTDPPGQEKPSRADTAAVYGEAVGKIRFIADSSRPDIAFAAKQLARALKTDVMPLEHLGARHSIPPQHTWGRHSHAQIMLGKSRHQSIL